MVDLVNEFLLSLLKVRHGVSLDIGVSCTFLVCTVLTYKHKPQPRPILFIAHSIGGTLIKQVGC